MRILSFDVGGSKISWAICDENGTLLSDVQQLPTPSTATQIEDIFRSVISSQEFDGFALATAGIVNNNQLTGKPHNLPKGYENIDFSTLVHTPYIIENDANSSLWAEYKLGSLKGVRHGVMLTLGTGVGCGIICNSDILRGKCGAAGEVLYKCCGTSMRHLATKYGCEHSDCFAIHTEAQKQDGPARQTYKKWQENLLDCLRSINHILDTEIVALSGSLSAIVDYAAINTMLKLLEPHNAPEVKPAQLGTHAGLVGAALLCAEKLKGENN